MQSEDDDFTSSSPQRIHFVHRKRGYFAWRVGMPHPKERSMPLDITITDEEKVAVHAAPGKRAQHQDIEGALQQGEFVSHELTIPSTFD